MQRRNYKIKFKIIKLINIINIKNAEKEKYEIIIYIISMSQEGFINIVPILTKCLHHNILSYIGFS